MTKHTNHTNHTKHTNQVHAKHPLAVSDVSNTQAFDSIRPEKTSCNSNKSNNTIRPRAVVIGGGTGAPVSIRTLLTMNLETSAVVAMADDGGSTGALRKHSDILPPGDIRKCIAAFSPDPNDPLTLAFKARFDCANGHSLGNLLLAALDQTTGSFPKAIEICEKMLNSQGHVFPSTLNRVRLNAQDIYGENIVGQANASHSQFSLEKVWLDSKKPVKAYKMATEAIIKADLIVLGPGSLFTSILPNLLVPEILNAINESKAPIVFVCALADIQGETRGMHAIHHYQALLRHGLTRLDFMLIHDYNSHVHSFSNIHEDDNSPDETSFSMDVKNVIFNNNDIKAINDSGTRTILRKFTHDKHSLWHDPRALRAAFAAVLRYTN